jgi:hypothetical protein
MAAILIAISRGEVAASAVHRNRKKFRWRAPFPKVPDLIFLAERRTASRVISPARNNNRRWIMPFLIPVLVGIPVLFGGGYIIYHLVH